MSYRDLFVQIENKVELTLKARDKLQIIVCPRCENIVRGLHFHTHFHSQRCKNNCKSKDPPEDYEIKFTDIGNMDLGTYKSRLL